ncbi:MAG: hypothetical protein A2Z29_08635 [Chloroflexi bacterium RBG_16_56_11]|nr:MAG: hypothetical protein A2Z29_08635 [Chloroflexi bacterium RBG_16_56_11]
MVSIIVGGGVFIGLSYRPSPDIEISLPEEIPFQGNIYIGGEVNNPGFYPLRPGDTIEDFLAAAGGPKDSAGLDYLALNVSAGNVTGPQKINLNRADSWLLQALPGVGEARAGAIIDYRSRHGPFRDIYELADVPGLGDAVFNSIKDMVTVVD